MTESMMSSTFLAFVCKRGGHHHSAEIVTGVTPGEAVRHLHQRLVRRGQLPADFFVGALYEIGYARRVAQPLVAKAEEQAQSLPVHTDDAQGLLKRTH